MREFLKRRSDRKQSALDKEIESILSEMALQGPGTEEYTAMAENLKTLYESKNLDKSKERRIEIFKTCSVVASNLLVMGLMMNFERLHIVSTKALQYVFSRFRV